MGSLARRVDPEDDSDPFEAAAEQRARTPADFKPVLPPPPAAMPIPLPDEGRVEGPPRLIAEPPIVSNEQPMPSDGDLDVDPIMVEFAGSMPLAAPAAPPEAERRGTDRTTRRATVRRSVSPLVQELVNANEEANAKPPPLRRSITEKIERADTTVMQPDEIVAPPAVGTGTERRTRSTTRRDSPDTDRVAREAPDGGTARQRRDPPATETERIRRELRSADTASRTRRDAGASDTGRVARELHAEAERRRRPPSTVDTAAVRKPEGERSDVIPFVPATGGVRPLPIAARDAWRTPLPRPLDPAPEAPSADDDLADRNARHLYGEDHQG